MQSKHNKTSLVTGSDGFIGRALIKHLVSSKHNAIGLDKTRGDIADPTTFNQFKNKDISRVFHLAAKTYVPDSWENPFSFYKANVIGTANTLEFCRQRSIPLVYVSGYIYGQPEHLPIPETAPLKANNPYAHSKLLGEQLCTFYNQKYGLQVVIIRPFNVFGLHQRQTFLIPHIIRQVLHSESIIVDNLAPKRDYIYIDDLVDALVHASEVKAFNIYNIGSGTSFSVSEIINTVQTILGTDKRIISHNKIRQNEINNVVADISKAKNELNWTPHFTFRDGLQSMLTPIASTHQTAIA